MMDFESSSFTFNKTSLKSFFITDYFRYIALIHIIINSFFLIAETTITENTEHSIILLYLIVDVYFVAFFVIECGLKLYSFGIYEEEDAYFKDTWNRLDFSVVILGLLNFIPGMANLTFLRSLRLLRSLSSFSKIPSLQLLLNTLIKSVSSIIDALLLMTFFIFLFSMISLQLFRGVNQYRCFNTTTNLFIDSFENGPTCSIASESQTLFMGTGRKCPFGTICINTNINPDAGVSNYDNILNSMLNNFMAITGEGWSIQMAYIEDSLTPIGANLFYIPMMIGIFVFIKEIFFAVLYYGFFQARKEANLTQDEIKIDNSMAIIPVASEAKIAKPEEDIYSKIRETTFEESLIILPLPFDEGILNQLCSWARYIHCNKYFDSISFPCIFINSIMLMNFYYGMNSETRYILIQFNFAFLLFYIFEIFVKFLGYGFRITLKVPSNVFDFIVIIASIIELFVSGGAGSISALRILRLLSLAQMWPEMGKLVRSTTPALRDLSFILLLVVLFVAIVTMFGVAFLQNKMSFDGVNSRNNFDNFLAGCYTVFQLITPERNYLVIQDSVRAIGYGGAVFCVLIIFVGHYVLESMFRVIMLSNIQLEENAKSVQLSLIIENILENIVNKIKALSEEQGPLQQILKIINEKKQNRDFLLENNAPRSDNKVGPISPNSISDDETELDPKDPKVQHLFEYKPDTSSELLSHLKRINNLVEESRTDNADSEVELSVLKTSEIIQPTLDPSHPSDLRQFARLFSSSHHQPTIGENIIAEMYQNGGTIPESSLEYDYHRSITNTSINSGFSTNFESTALSDMPSLWSISQHDFGKFTPVYASPPTDRILASCHSSVPLITLFHHHPPSDFTFIYTQKFPQLDPNVSSLWFFDTDTTIRMLANDISVHPGWNAVMLIITVLSCIILMVDDSYVTQSEIQVVDTLVSAFFLLDLCLNLIAFGFIMHPGSYFRLSYWKIIDSLVAISSIAYLYNPLNIVLKCLRALRFIKLISFFRTLRNVTSSIINSLLGMGSVMVFTSIFILAFAVIAVQFFGGTLAQCVSLTGAVINVDQIDCTSSVGVWTNPINMGNFDNVFNSALFLFELMTEENWPNFMYALIDSSTPGKARILNYNQWKGCFIILWIIIGSWFLKNLFSGFAISSFTREYYRLVGSVDLTPAQNKWLKIYKLIVDVLPPAIYSKPIPFEFLLKTQNPFLIAFRDFDLFFRRSAFKLVLNPNFERASIFVILINMIIMTISFYNEPVSYGTALVWINYTCTIYFTVELVILLLGIGISNYFNNSWNVVDFVVVVASLVDFVIFLTGANFTLNISFLRTLRLLRALRLLREYKQFNLLLKTLIFSLPRLTSAVIITLLIYSFFAVIFMAAFGDVKFGSYLSSYGNFGSFSIALSTLFKMVTGENWNGLMRDCMIQPPFCDPLVDCGDQYFAPIIFTLFQVVGSLLLINLVVSIILEQFQEELIKIDIDDSEFIDQLDIDDDEEDVDDYVNQASLTSGISSQLSRMSTFSRSKSGIALHKTAAYLLQDENSIREFSKIWSIFSKDDGTKLPIRKLPSFFRLLMRCNPSYRTLIRNEKPLDNVQPKITPSISDIERWSCENNEMDIPALEIWDFIDALSLPSEGAYVHYFDVISRCSWFCICKKELFKSRKIAKREYNTYRRSHPGIVLMDKKIFADERMFQYMHDFVDEVQYCSTNDRVQLIRSLSYRNWSEISRPELWKYPVFLVSRIVRLQKIWKGKLVRRTFKKVVTAISEINMLKEDER